jgi:hypothetical protein
VSEILAQMFQFYHNIVFMQMKTTVVADILSDLTNVSERLAQMIQFYHNIVYMQVAICYEGQFVNVFHKV